MRFCIVFLDDFELIFVFKIFICLIIFPIHRSCMLLVFFTNSLALIETNMSEYFDKTYSLVSLFPIKGLCGSKTPSNFTKACSKRRFVIKTLPRIYDGGFLQKEINDFNPANLYLFKVNNRNTRKRCEISIFHTFFWFVYCWL